MTPSAESESVSRDAGIFELDLEGPIAHCAGLADQLVKPVLDDGARTIGSDVDAVIVARHRAVDAHAKLHRFAVVARPEHEMQVASLETERDSARRGVQHALLFADGPVAVEPPLVQRELGGDCVSMRNVSR